MAGSSPAPGRGERRRTFFRIRVLALLAALAVAAAWAAGVRRDRRARTAWDRTLDVSVVLLVRGPAEGPGAARVAAGLPGLAARLAEERERHAGPGPAPFAFAVRGPVAWAGAFPVELPAGGLLARARHALEVWRTLRAAEAAAGPADGPADARLYLLLDPGRAGGRGYAEGAGARGGEVGLVRAWVEGADASLALSALGHELLHCLGASDKYDGAGHAVPPGGLAEPDREPPYPQRFAEWMVGEVPLGPGQGRVPASLAELAVGPETAREIGWGP